MSHLKQLRQSAGLTQNQLAGISGVNLRMIQHYEQGQKDINRAEAITVYKLASALKVRMEDLIVTIE